MTNLGSDGDVGTPAAIAIGVDVAPVVSYHDQSNELPLGSWRLLANGRVFVLDITAVNGRRVDASMSSGTLGNARWSCVANASTVPTLTFTRLIASHDLKQRLTGYLLHFDPEDPLWRLAGTYGDVEVGDQAGWYTTLPKRI